MTLEKDQWKWGLRNPSSGTNYNTENDLSKEKKEEKFNTGMKFKRATCVFFQNSVVF